jgi:hypothetical protein
LNESQRGLAVRSLFNLKPFGLEQAAKKLTDRLLVVDDEDRGPAPDGTVGSSEGCVHTAFAGRSTCADFLKRRPRT